MQAALAEFGMNQEQGGVYVGLLVTKLDKRKNEIEVPIKHTRR